MIPANFKEYLKGYATGIVSAQLDAVANTAMEVSFASVWGAHDWKFKRTLVAGTLTANQAFTNLPSDFESTLSIRIIHSDRPKSIDIKDENAFDYDYPNPAAVQKDMPFAAKIVLHAGTTWRVYWFPIPDSGYSYEMAYNRKADLALLPNVPSYMLGAILEKGKAIMQGSPERTFTQTQVAESELQRAILADRVAAGYAPMLGSDPGWDDFALTSGGGSVWDPHTL